jgi:hypothetical protein
VKIEQLGADPPSGRNEVMLAGRWGPVVLAVALGILSVPFVAVALIQPFREGEQDYLHAPPLDWPGALVLALVSATTASVVGGSVGGMLVRSRPVIGALVAIGTAWPIAISMLSVTSAAFGISLRKAVVCIDECSASITDQGPFSGAIAYVGSLLGSALLIFPPIACLLLLIVGVALARRGRIVWAIVVVVGAYAALHTFSLFYGGGIAMACLAIGVTIWAIKLRRTGTDQVEQRGRPVIPPVSPSGSTTSAA